jgi:hypothetical protein
LFNAIIDIIMTNHLEFEFKYDIKGDTVSGTLARYWAKPLLCQPEIMFVSVNYPKLYALYHLKINNL